MNKQDMINQVEEALQDEDIAEIFTSEFPWAMVVPPSREDKVRGGLLDPWWEHKTPSGELLYVEGYIHGDERFPYSTTVRTSYVVDLLYSDENQSGTVETRNSVYQLGRKLVKTKHYKDVTNTDKDKFLMEVEQAEAGGWVRGVTTITLGQYYHCGMWRIIYE